MSKSDKPKTTVDRRTFLSQSGAAVAATATAATAASPVHAAVTPTPHTATPVVRSAKHHVTLMTPWADAPFGLSAHAHSLAQAITVLSDNAIQVTVGTHDNGQTEPENILLLDTEQRYVSKHPAFAYFAGLPLRQSLDANSLDAWLAVGGGQHLWDQLAGEFSDDKPLLAGHLGTRPGLWSTKPIRTLTDLQACTAASSGLGQNILRAVDIPTVDVTCENISNALADGTITAVEFGSAYVNHMIGIHAHAKHVATGGLHFNGSMLSLRIKRTLWDRMAPMHQAALSAAAAQSFRTTHAEALAHATFMKTNLMRHDGVKFSTFSAEIRATFNKVSEAVVAQAAGTDALSRRIDTGYMGFRRTISQQIPMM